MLMRKLSLLMLPKLVIFSLLLIVISEVSYSQQNAPIEVITKKDDLEEIQLKSRLEDRLARDIQAYLGHGRFIINVDVTLQKIRQVVKGKTTSVPKSRNNNNQNSNYPELRFPRSSRDTQDSNITPDDQVESLPGLPFVDIPADKEKDAELAFMREQIQRLQRQQRQPKWEDESGQPNGGQQTAPDTTVGVFNKIKKLTISLVVENDVNSEQQAFIRNLVYQKASLNDLRGDSLTIVKTEFSKLPEDVVEAALDKETAPAQGWLEKNFNILALGLLSLLAFLLIALILLSFRKKEVPVSQQSNSLSPNVGFSERADHSIADATVSDHADNRQIMLRTRQEIISLGLGQPQAVQSGMSELVAQEDKIPMIASIYKVLGRSLFRSIFPNVEQMQLQSVMAQLADRPPEEEQQFRDLQDFHQILQQKIQNIVSVKAHPFEFLNKLNDSQVLYLMQHEDPRIQALVVSQLDSQQAARVLNRVPDKHQSQLIAELGQFETFPMDTFKDVADRLAKAAQQVPSFENVNADGLGMLMSMLDNMSSSEESKVLKRLKQDKPDTFYRLRQLYFTFSDVIKTPHNVLSNALREVDRNHIGQSLCSTPDDFKIHVLKSLNSAPKLKAQVRDDLRRFEGNISPQEIDQSRRSIVHKIREYINIGKFSMDQLETPENKAS
ncbi:MAG: flagellar motor switch protein FliG [Bermanella sp.]|jgi:flagellar motor switch protein FliG